MNNISTAVVGAGFIGPVHVEALRRLGVNITGILGYSPAESETARAALGLPKAYENLDEVLADEQVDAVHLAVPNALHFEFSKRALEAGKHVMCEKPLAMDSTEAGELVKLAASKGLVAGVCYNVRYYPLNIQARAMIQAGELGDVNLVTGSYVQDWLLYDTDYNWRVLADQGGALRAVADIGTHWMDLVLSITGLEIESVFADLKTVHPIRRRPKGEVKTFTGKAEHVATEPVDINTEDYGCVMLRFNNGGRGVFHVSQVTAGRKNCIRYEISGSKQTLAWNSEEPNQIWIGRRNEPNQLMLKDPGLVSDAARHYINYPGGHNEGFPDAFKQCFRSFYDRIASGDHQSPPTWPTFEEGCREVALCEAILESHRQERWITL